MARVQLAVGSVEPAAAGPGAEATCHMPFYFSFFFFVPPAGAAPIETYCFILSLIRFMAALI